MNRNDLERVTFSPIGKIVTPHETIGNMPIQPASGAGYEGQAILLPEYSEALTDLDGFSHIYLIFHLHLSVGYQLKVKPFLDDKEHGLFATRTPKRPVPIGLSLVELISVEDNVIRFKGADMLNNTPLLDIKPFARQFDVPDHSTSGWLENKTREQVRTARSDQRFK